MEPNFNFITKYESIRLLADICGMLKFFQLLLLSTTQQELVTRVTSRKRDFCQPGISARNKSARFLLSNLAGDKKDWPPKKFRPMISDRFSFACYPFTHIIIYLLDCGKRLR